MVDNPRVFTERDRIRNLPWVQKAKNEYRTNINNDQITTFTTFQRSDRFIELIDRTLPQINNKPSLLIAGLGFNTGSVACSYVPYRIGAHLQGKKIDYQMTLVDISREIIEDVRTRETIFLNVPKIDNPGASSDFYRDLRLKWQSYLSNIGQVDRAATINDVDLRFVPSITTEDQAKIISGIRAADVSTEFRTKLANGSIQLKEGDLALVDLSTSEPFDFVDLSNILDYLSPAGQKLALANIASNMKTGGSILKNEILDSSLAHPILARFGGWLTEQMLIELGLEAKYITYIRGIEVVQFNKT